VSTDPIKGSWRQLKGKVLEELVQDGYLQPHNQALLWDAQEKKDLQRVPLEATQKNVTGLFK